MNSMKRRSRIDKNGCVLIAEGAIAHDSPSFGRDCEAGILYAPGEGLKCRGSCSEWFRNDSELYADQLSSRRTR